MSITNQFLSGLKAYQEIKAELGQEKTPQPASLDTPSLELLSEKAPGFPGGSLLLGIAEDGLPVLIDLYDPSAGPLLVAGDGGTGKTAVLQSLARASSQQDPGDIEFGVLTPFPEEWTALESLPNGMGIWPAYHPSARNFMSQLIGWAETLPETRQAVLLLIDGLDLLAGSGFPSQQDLRWLLMYGPERQIWPVVTVNPGRLSHLQNWLDYFHSRILGQVKQARNARLLLDSQEVDLADLLPGIQFGLSQPGGWLKFLLPPFI